MTKLQGIDVLLLRGASINILMGLILAWCLIGFYTLEAVREFFPGNIKRIVSAHLDFLIMGAIIYGISATKIKLATIVKWCMVIGAFTNSSIFIIFVIFPVTDPGSETFVFDSVANIIFKYVRYLSFIITTVGFGGAAISIIRTTIKHHKTSI